MDVKKYDRLEGVTDGFYYLIKVTSFGDFEDSYKDEIIFECADENSLANFCVKKYGVNPLIVDSWKEYIIRYKPKKES